MRHPITQSGAPFGWVIHSEMKMRIVIWKRRASPKVGWRNERRTRDELRSKARSERFRSVRVPCPTGENQSPSLFLLSHKCRVRVSFPLTNNNTERKTDHCVDCSIAPLLWRNLACLPPQPPLLFFGDPEKVGSCRNLCLVFFFLLRVLNAHLVNQVIAVQYASPPCFPEQDESLKWDSARAPVSARQCCATLCTHGWHFR